MYLNGIPFNVLTSPEFRAIHNNHYDNYTVLSRITFNNNIAHYYRCFVISCAEKSTRGIQQHHGKPFLYVINDTVTLNYGNDYLAASVSFMVDSDLYRLAVTFIPNNLSHSINYNADLLPILLKETFELDIYRFTKLMASDTTNLATSVARFFSPMAVQVDFEMHQLNLCQKYAFGICENYRSEGMIDKNGVVIRNVSGMKFIPKFIVTPDGSFLEGEALV